MKIFLKLFKRELKLFFSNSVAVFIFFAAPIGYGLLVGSAYQQAKLTNMDIMVVDSDDTPLSNDIIEALDDNQYLKVAEVLFKHTDVEQKVIENDYVAVVYIPDQFEANILQKRQPEVNVELNGANMVKGNYASSGIQSVLGTMNAGIEIESLMKQGMPKVTAQTQFTPFLVTVNRFYNPANNYLLFVWPGIMGTVMQQVILIIMALSFSREFEEKTFRGLVKLSDSPGLLLFIKSFPIFVMTLLMWALVYYLFYPVFNVMLPANGFANWTMVLIFTLANIALGTTISVLIPSQLKSTEILMAISLPSFILSGFTWPLDGMPGWLIHYVSDLIPLTHFLSAYRKLQLMDVGLGAVRTELLILTGMTILLLAVTWIALWFRVHRVEKQQHL